MYTLINSLSIRHFVVAQAPTMTIALVVAELVYKFHSFTLECAAFLATWFVFDLARSFVAKKLRFESPPHK